MSATHLTGLSGTNPLGFLAALGVQVLFEDEERQPRLWWTDGVVPHAIVDSHFDIPRIVAQCLDVFQRWLESPALNPRLGGRADDTAKFRREDLTEYLRRSSDPQPGNKLAYALVAEGGLDGSGKIAKPSHLYFAAGQLKFLKIVRDILERVEPDQIEEGLIGPWSYSSGLSSLGWDVTDDRLYALGPTNPAKDKKLTNPGAESLAVLGLSRHPVFADRGTTLTSGCSGPWRRGGAYTWPIWTRPAGTHAVRCLLAHATGDDKAIAERSRWYTSWGVSTVLRSTIRRSDQGGYGTFGPPQALWSCT